MDRIADPFRLYAEAVDIDWSSVAGHRKQLVGDVDHGRLELRRFDVRLNWACSASLGVPLGPFTVWHRSPGRQKPQRIAATLGAHTAGLRIDWDGTAAGHVVVDCTPITASRAVGLYLYRVGEDGVTGLVGYAAASATGGTVRLDARSTGATWAVLANGQGPQVRITPLQEIVTADDWKPLEIVGLPVPQPWNGTDYDASEQGLVDALTDPVTAAVQRISRGGPPLGWDAKTPAGLLAPPWDEPDPMALIDEIHKNVLPAIQAMYDGRPEFAQFLADAWQAAEPSHVDGAAQASSLDARANPKPWAVLGMTAQIDPFLNLASGFGSAYSVEQMTDEQVGIGGDELLVTAAYRSVLAPHEEVEDAEDLPGGVGAAEFAAYAPRGVAASRTPAPSGLVASREGLVEPRAIDRPWAESVRLQHRRVEPSARLSSPTQQAGIVADEVDPHALPVIERRDPQGWRTVAVSPDGPAPTADQPVSPDYDKTSLMHAPAEIRLLSGERRARYAVSIADVRGIWSPWRDAAHHGPEPTAELPGITSARLSTDYAGSDAVPATLTVDVAVEWVERSTTRIDIQATFTGTPPGPAFARQYQIAFDLVGRPSGVGCSVIELNPDGTAPLGSGTRDDTARRFRITASVPTLDFHTARRWNVAVRARRALTIGGPATGYSPATVVGADSPVPVRPLVPPQPPGVPLASMPDAQGRPHTAVTWSIPTGAAARTAVVWECAETALRQKRGLAPRADAADSPSDRLVALYDAYDALSPKARRAAFRRVAEVDAAARSTDVPLPRGSTDIHLFMVTLVTTAAVESPWPDAAGATPAHAHLQAAIAPRLVRPEQPTLRAAPVSVGGAAHTRLTLEAASPIRVTVFHLMRTRNERAALRADTMGPPFAEPAASPKPHPDDPAEQAVDPVSGHPLYEAVWEGMLPPSWAPWLLRARAIPQDVEPQLALRGLTSAPTDAVPVPAPPATPPMLEPLVVEQDATHAALTILTATTAPDVALAAGDHVLRARILGLGPDPVDAAETTLPDVEQAGAFAPPGAAPRWQRGPRASGTTPLALTVTRPDPAAEVTVEVTLADPRGRTTVTTVTVPGWTPPTPTPFAVSILGITPRPLSGLIVGVRTTAPARAGYRLRIVGKQGRVFPMPARRTIDAEVPLSSIPISPRRPITVNGVSFRRTRTTLGDLFPKAIEIAVPLASPATIAVTVTGPDGTTATDSGRA